MDEEWGINFKEEKNLWKEYISQLLLSPRICLTWNENFFNITENYKCSILNPFIMTCGKF